MPQARLGSYYGRASLFVLPCTVLANGDRDGIPNVLAEAMATGLPVVTTPISGIPEIVEDDFNGLFVPSEDAIALADGMARLLQDGALRAKLGHNARQTILEKFDSARTTRRLRALLSCEQEPVFSVMPATAMTLSDLGLESPPRVRCQVDLNECGPGTADAVLAGQFTFNGETHSLGAQFDWRRNPSADREWLILLNKFYFAPALAVAWRDSGDTRYLARWIELTTSWIESGMDCGFIAADVTGRRVQNWCIAFHAARQGPAPLPGRFVREFLVSLEAQAAWLRDNLHESRNHRTLELYALLLCAVAFPGLARSRQWRDFAIVELSRNALADFRADGGHREQSTHYHCIALRNHLHSLQLMRDNGLEHDPVCLERLGAAAHFAARMHLPDGRIAAFSDSDRGNYLDTLLLAADLLDDAELRFMASGGQAGVAPASGSTHFPDSGYAVLRSPWQAPRPESAPPMQLVFDCGPLGEGNHGHFDLLSFEAHAGGEAVVVDPGRYTYDEAGPFNWRAAFRETRAHSTVEVDGRNQVRYEQGPRRMKVRGPEPAHFLRELTTGTGFACVAGTGTSAEYDVVHQRRILQVHGAFWVIVDDLASESMHHLSRPPAAGQPVPGWTAGRHDRRCIARSRAAPGHSPALLRTPHARRRTGGGVSMRYGERRPAPRLCLESQSRALRIATIIIPGQAGTVDTRRALEPGRRLDPHSHWRRVRRAAARACGVEPSAMMEPQVPRSRHAARRAEPGARLGGAPKHSALHSPSTVSAPDPARRVVIGATATCHSGGNTWQQLVGLRRLAPGRSGARFADASLRAVHRSHCGPGVLHLADLDTVAWLFPNDCKITGAHALADRELFGQFNPAAAHGRVRPCVVDAGLAPGADPLRAGTELHRAALGRGPVRGRAAAADRQVRQ